MIETCQRCGVLDLRVFYSLPEWVQRRQLAHTVNLLQDAYSSPPEKERPKMSIAEGIAEDRRRSEARRAAAGASDGR